MKKQDDLKRQVSEAILACQDKQADDLTILELEKDSGAFTDYFVMCSGANSRQVQAIADAVDELLEALGLRTTEVRGERIVERVEVRLAVNQDRAGHVIEAVERAVVHSGRERLREMHGLRRTDRNLALAELVEKRDEHRR